MNEDELTDVMRYFLYKHPRVFYAKYLEWVGAYTLAMQYGGVEGVIGIMQGLRGRDVRKLRKSLQDAILTKAEIDCFIRERF